MKKYIIVYCDSKADKAVIRSVIPENVPQYLENMALDFSKYNKLKAHRQKHKDQDTIITLEELQRNKNH